MAAGKLDGKDIFLINRETSPNSGIWKSYQVNYEQILGQLGEEITIDLPIVGYTDKLTDIDDTDLGKLRFTSEPPKSGDADMTSITALVFHSSQREILKGNKDEEIEVYNQDTKEAVTYTLSQDARSVTKDSKTYLQLDLTYKEGSGTLSVGDEVSIRPLTVSSGGGSINIGENPPVDPEEGTLWYNPNNGITYIWYVNIGTGGTNDDGQWVDVRPGGAGGGGDAPVGGVDFSAGDGLELDLSTDPDTLKVVAIEGKGVEVESSGIKIGNNWSNIPVLPIV